MAVPNLILNKGQILLLESYSKQGIILTNNDYIFTNVMAINALSELYAVGDYVTFNPVDATLLIFGTDTYYLTTEDKIIFKEG
jgi:hypothetical protein